MFELLAFGDTGYGDEIVRGACVTLLISTLAFIIGLAIGLVFAGMRLSGNIVLSSVADFYTTVVRGVPELIIIYLLLDAAGPLAQLVVEALQFRGSWAMDAFLVGLIALSVISGAYSTEVWRAGLQAVPVGQVEAARAFGMNSRQRFFRIVLPQALRHAVPGFGNVWQLMIKNTALISVTGLAELMRNTSVAARVSKQPFTFYLFALVLFLVITSLSAIVFERAEKRLGRGERRTADSKAADTNAGDNNAGDIQKNAVQG
ncbi:MAG: ABC transporter permease subunit [Pseudomonadota bacterium]